MTGGVIGIVGLCERVKALICLLGDQLERLCCGGGMIDEQATDRVLRLQETLRR